MCVNEWKRHTGSLVSGGLLTCRPNTSSWNWSSWTTRLDRDLLVGGSAWMYCEDSKTERQSELSHREHTYTDKLVCL